MTSTHPYPDGVDEFEDIRADITDVNLVLNVINHGVAESDFIRAFIFALRDLQRCCDTNAYDADNGASDADIRAAGIAAGEAYVRIADAVSPLMKMPTVTP
jgi:hypothetical protein